MKKTTLIVFILLCFGIAKAHFLPRNFKTLKPQIEIRVLNALPDYSVTFRFFPKEKFIYGPAPKAISFQNKLSFENSHVAIKRIILRNLIYLPKNDPA